MQGWWEFTRCAGMVGGEVCRNGECVGMCVM